MESCRRSILTSREVVACCLWTIVRCEPQKQCGELWWRQTTRRPSILVNAARRWESIFVLRNVVGSDRFTPGSSPFAVSVVETLSCSIRQPSVSPCHRNASPANSWHVYFRISSTSFMKCVENLWTKLELRFNVNFIVYFFPSLLLLPLPNFVVFYLELCSERVRNTNEPSFWMDCARISKTPTQQR